MASLAKQCLTPKAKLSLASSNKLSTSFIGGKRRQTFAQTVLREPNNSRVTCWFKFGKNGLDAEGAGIYGSQGRDDFDVDDIEHYFNYMGMLASEGSYDSMEELVKQGNHPVDILLLLAATEGDKPKIQELLKAGARIDVTDTQGRTALDRAQDDEIRKLIEEGVKASV